MKEINFPPFQEEEIPLWVDAIVEERNSLTEFLKMRNIHIREAWPAIHRNPPFHSYGSDKDFPVSSKISDNVIWLPNGPALQDEDINYICENIKAFYRENK